MKPVRADRATVKSQRRWHHRLPYLLAAIFCIALSVRVIALIDASDNPTFSTPITDAGTYDMVARNIWQTGQVDDHLFWQPPLYPLQLALIYALSDGSIVVAKVVQAIIGALSCCLVFLIARRQLGRTAGLLATAITSVYGPLILFEGELLAAGSAACWAATLILLFGATENHRALWLWALISVICALAVLMRPTFLPFVIVISAYQLYLRWRRSGWRQGAAALAMGGLAFAVIALPFALWNGNVTGRQAFLPASGGVNFHLGNNPEVCRTLTIRPGFAWEQLMAEPAGHGFSGPDASSRFFSAEVRRYLQDDPVGFVAGLGRKALQLVSSREIPRNLDVYLWSRWSKLNAALTWKLGAFGFPYGLLLPMAVLGLVFRGRRLGMPLLAFIFLYGAAIVLVFVTARYRVPLIPALAVAAAAGIQAVAEAVRQRRWPRLSIMALVVAATVLLATLPGPFCEEQQNMEADFHFGLGAAQFSRGRNDEAWNSFASALVADPTQAQFHYNFGVSSQQRGDPNRAEEHYRKALRLEPGYAPARNNLATLLASSGQPAAAIDQLREAIRFNPRLANSYRNLIRLLIDTSKPREALELSEKLLTMDASQPGDLVLKGQALLLLGDYTAAVEVLEQAVARGAGEVEALLNLGVALLAAGDAQAGLEQFEAVIAHYPDNAGAYLRAGIALSELGRLAEAKDRLESALSLEPGNVKARALLEQIGEAR